MVGAMADEARDYVAWRAEKLADPEIRAEFDALEEECSAVARRALCAGGNVELPIPPLGVFRCHQRRGQ